MLKQKYICTYIIICPWVYILYYISVKYFWKIEKYFLEIKNLTFPTKAQVGEEMEQGGITGMSIMHVIFCFFYIKKYEMTDKK